jgi:hypothetical protein
VAVFLHVRPENEHAKTMGYAFNSAISKKMGLIDLLFNSSLKGVAEAWNTTPELPSWFHPLTLKPTCRRHCEYKQCPCKSDNHTRPVTQKLTLSFRWCRKDAHSTKAPSTRFFKRERGEKE